MSLPSHGVEASSVPRHVAIIMDGNGRWAQQRGLPRFRGHHQGVEAVRRTARQARDLGIEVLTLFSFSTENWSRPAAEVSELFGLLRLFVRRDLAELVADGVRVRVIGNRADLPADIRALVEEAETRTRANTRHTLVIAFNYGGRDELVRAARRLARRVAEGTLRPDAIDDAAITSALDTADLPDPDLIIRTSGEMRLSNFLLWQAAYAELVFVDTLWPDFSQADLVLALDRYARRSRRFGGLAQRALVSS